MDMLAWWNDAERGEIGQSFCLALCKADILLQCRIHVSCTLTDAPYPYHNITASCHLFLQICAVTCVYTTAVWCYNSSVSLIFSI
jgi:hypothetical protein